MPFVTKADAAELGRGPVSVTPYISAEYFELERDQRFSQEYILATFRDAVAEDVPVLKTLQLGMASGARSVMHFQLTEAMCRHTYNSIDRSVRDIAG